MASAKTEILVTGATGFIGGHLAETLVASGQPVRLLVRDPQRLSDVLRSAGEIIIGDLSNLDALKIAARQVKTVYHCAANVSTWGAWNSYAEANVQGVENLLKAITQVNDELPRYIHLSSVDVYGFPVAPCDETAPPADNGFNYGKSKLLGETLVREYGKKFGLPYTILRPCNVIGPGSQFIERIGNELRAGVMLTVSRGNCNAGLIYVDNLVDYILRAAASSTTLGECYNVRGNYDVSWQSFIKSFRQRISGKGLVIDLPFTIANTIAFLLEIIYKILPTEKEPFLHRLIVHIFGRTCGHSQKKINEACGMATNYGFEDALEKSCRWFLTHRQ